LARVSVYRVPVAAMLPVVAQVADRVQLCRSWNALPVRMKV
jgi:hypothetical protein